MPHLGYLKGRRLRPSEAGPRGLGRTARTLRGFRDTLLPRQLVDYALTGPRRPGHLRIILANDVSGSMTEFAAAREAALSQFVTWASANLRVLDEIGVLDFAETARWTLMPRPVCEHDLTEAKSRRAALEGGGTAWAPVLARVARLPGSSSHTALWLVSDGQYPDYPPDQDTAGRVLRDAGVDSCALLVPAPGIDVPDLWHQTFADALYLSFDGRSADQTALALAQAVAQATGQHLVRLQ